MCCPGPPWGFSWRRCVLGSEVLHIYPPHIRFHKQIAKFMLECHHYVNGLVCRLAVVGRHGMRFCIRWVVVRGQQPPECVCSLGVCCALQTCKWKATGPVNIFKENYGIIMTNRLGMYFSGTVLA